MRVLCCSHAPPCCLQNPDKDGWSKRVNTRGDSGFARRVRLCNFTTRFEKAESKEEADAMIARASAPAEDDEEQEDVHVMYKQKHDELMSLAPDLMSLMIDMHMDATRPGGAGFPDTPVAILHDTNAMLEEIGAPPAARTDEPDTEKVFDRNFQRCACANEPPQHDDQWKVKASKLHYWDNGAQQAKLCTHCVSAREIADAFKLARLQGGRSLYEVLQTGVMAVDRGRSHLPVVKHAFALLASKYQAGTNNDLNLELDIVDRERGASRRNVLYGFERRPAPAGPAAGSAAGPRAQ